MFYSHTLIIELSQDMYQLSEKPEFMSVISIQYSREINTKISHNCTHTQLSKSIFNVKTLQCHINYQV